MKFWLASGSLENLKISFNNSKWGLNKRLKGLWIKASKGDILFFYAPKPIGGLVGIGVIESKNEEETLLWTDEVFLGKVLYPYRLYFRILHLLKEEKWENDKIPKGDLKIVVQAGMNHIRNEETLNDILNRICNSWGIEIR